MLKSIDYSIQSFLMHLDEPLLKKGKHKDFSYLQEMMFQKIVLRKIIFSYVIFNLVKIFDNQLKIYLHLESQLNLYFLKNMILKSDNNFHLKLRHYLRRQ